MYKINDVFYNKFYEFLIKHILKKYTYKSKIYYRCCIYNKKNVYLPFLFYLADLLDRIL